jgi:hypothetical protein
LTWYAYLYAAFPFLYLDNFMNEFTCGQSELL